MSKFPRKKPAKDLLDEAEQILADSVITRQPLQLEPSPQSSITRETCAHEGSVTSDAQSLVSQKTVAYQRQISFLESQLQMLQQKTVDALVRGYSTQTKPRTEGSLQTAFTQV